MVAALTAPPAALVTVTAGRTTVGLDMRRVVGVERADRVKPAEFAGGPGRVVNRAGEWPVLSLAEHLGESLTADGVGRVVLVEAAGERVGLLVDRVSPVRRATADRISAVPPALADGPFSGVALLETGPVLLLDLDRLAGGPAPPTADPVGYRRVRAADRRRLLLLLGEVEHPGPGGRRVSFGVPADVVIEVFDPAHGRGGPGAGPHLRQVVEWRDQAVSVIDLVVWCGFPAPTAGRRVAVVRTAAGPVGVPAGPAVRMLPAGEPHMPTRRPLPLIADRVLGAFDTREASIVLPSLIRLVAEQS